MTRKSAVQLKSRRGQAMVVAILALTVLTAGAIAISAAARLELRASRRGVDQVRREAALRGAVNRGIALLEQGRTDPEQLLAALRAHGEVRWTPLAASGGEGEADPDRIPMMVAVQLIDASSRIDLLKVSSEQLQKLPELDRDRETVRAILDWRDEDEGDDDRDYLDRARPYQPKDRPFDTMEELLLINRLDAGKFFGRPSIQETLQLRTPPLSELLTIFSGENNSDAAGNARLDVNEAEADELLEAANRERTVLNEAQVQRIIARRDQHELQQAGGGAQPGQSEKAFPNILDAIRETSVGVEYWGDLLDAWTADPRDFLPARVNVNTASEEVMETISGLTDEMRNKLLNTRRERPEGLAWKDVLDAIGVQAQQPQDGTPQPGQPQQQQQQQRPGQQVLDQIAIRSAVYWVRCLAREGTSPRVDAAMALVYWPMDPSDAPRIVQWRQPDKFPGWTAWYHPPAW